MCNVLPSPGCLVGCAAVLFVPFSVHCHQTL